MKRAGLSALGVLLLVSTCVFSQARPEPGEDLKQQLTALTEKWMDADRSRDVAFLEKLLAPDFTGLNSAGRTLNKAELIDGLKSHRLIRNELHAEVIDVHVYGNVAIVIDRTTAKGIDDGKPYSAVVRFVRVFVRQRGAWRAEYAQATPLTSEARNGK